MTPLRKPKQLKADTSLAGRYQGGIPTTTVTGGTGINQSLEMRLSRREAAPLAGVETPMTARRILAAGTMTATILKLVKAQVLRSQVWVRASRRQTARQMQPN